MRASRPPLLVLLLATVGCGVRPSAEVRVLAAERSVEFTAVVDASAFEKGDMAGYHLVVWRDGRAADQALLRADVSDVQVLDALEALGAVPGNALGIETWNERDDPHSWKPDQVIAGPEIAMSLLLPDRPTPVSIGEVLNDPGGRGIALRFGGHRANIAEWQSGCVVCLYSCPGGKVGNARYTVRDFVDGTTRFRARPNSLPRDGTRITVRLTLGTS